MINHYTHAEIITLLREDPQALQTSSRDWPRAITACSSFFEESWRQLDRGTGDVGALTVLLPN
ncbi:MAG: hypothetical protein R2867_46350 [Caldilineaceae bacterium]